jgi:ribosomal protein S18 acetylase RimI-like enzyme
MTIEAGPDEMFTTKARAEDAEALTDLVNGAYRGDSSRRGWTTEADLLGGQRIDLEGMLALIAAPRQAVLVMRARSGLFACVNVLEKPDHVAYLGMLTVRPALQGSGIGRRMLSAAESYARHEWGSRVMEMTVIDLREELLAWYERRGYRPTGEIRPFPYEDERFGLPKTGDLRMAVLARDITT